MRNFFEKSAYVAALVLMFTGVISCEKDFTDIGSGVISNNKFDIKDTVLEVFVNQRDIDAVRGDNISTGSTGEFLLGVYANDDYEKIEASFVSQLLNSPNIDRFSGASSDTIITPVFDNAFIKLPYIATNKGVASDGKPIFTLDSVLGKTTTGISLKVYRNLTYLNTLDPNNPSKFNRFNSDSNFTKGDLLNENASFTVIPNSNDTIYVYDRNYNGTTFKDTLKLTNSNPFLVIPLDKTKMKSLFFDKFDSAEFASQEAFNTYFNGLIIEASGSENSLLPFKASGTFAPSLEINYTNELLRVSTGEKDTIKNTASFNLFGVHNRIYKMTPEVNTPSTEQVIVQGAAGKYATVDILQNGQVADLKAKDLLINDATLTFYIDKTKDTTHIPLQLLLYKETPTYSSHIKDIYSEGLSTFSGLLVDDENGFPDYYSFKITDYISDVLDNTTNANNAPLVLKVYNTTDSPFNNQVLDTIVTNYSWNPRAVTLTNHIPSGIIKGSRKAQLKISYTKKKD